MSLRFLFVNSKAHACVQSLENAIINFNVMDWTNSFFPKDLYLHNTTIWLKSGRAKKNGSPTAALRENKRHVLIWREYKFIWLTTCTDGRKSWYLKDSNLEHWVVWSNYLQEERAQNNTLCYSTWCLHVSVWVDDTSAIFPGRNLDYPDVFSNSGKSHYLRYIHK